MPASKNPSGGGPRVVLVDGTNTLYRAFFALPGLRAPDGSPTNAAYGFVTMLGKILREERPDYLVVVFDSRRKTFRHRLYDDYKAGRDAQPEDLSAQLPIVRELVEAYRLPVIDADDFEADDVIACLAKRAPEGAQVAIVSTDKDLMQLVDERTVLLDGIRERRYGPSEVEARFGVPPARVLDLRALVGDPSDNIPGVKGIGEKGAAKLIQEWHDLENLLAHADEVMPKRARTALQEQADEARLSKRLATLRTDIDVPDWDALALGEPDLEGLRALYRKLGFSRLLQELGAGTSAAVREETSASVDVIADIVALDGVVAALLKRPSVPLAIVADGMGPTASTPVGIAFATDEHRAAYVPLGPAGLTVDEVLDRLRPLLGVDGAVGWIGVETKRAQALLAERGLETALPHFDVGIAGQLLDSSGAHNVAALAVQNLGRELRSWEELAGRGAKAKAAADLPVADVAQWAADEVCAIAALHAPLTRRLDEDGLAELFEEVELPLTRVLARMERAGVRTDEAVLAGLSVEYERDLGQIEADIYRLAGGEFLVSSPKQLQQILFEKLKLPVIRKTKTGYSTDEGVLEQLAAHHELPARILAYRRLAKLKNTYVDALPPLINPATGRIHPTFNQLGAATGRLSAANPNVQNIPIRTPEGIRIREAFIPAEGQRLVSADYSQVELRILAHYCEDEGLIAAFERGDDIHQQTAAEVLDTAPEDVNPDQRARAKAINFGIIYGLSAFGLANQLGIASAEAQQMIDAYFERYRGVRRFIDETIREAREIGFVRTLLGRRRYLPDLSSRNRTLRQAAERMAVNTVIQGTAADLIKRAMLAVDAAMQESKLGARMILQVHDELVLEAPTAQVSAVAERVRVVMEGVLPLRVPLRVEVGSGANWREAH